MTRRHKPSVLSSPAARISDLTWKSFVVTNVRGENDSVKFLGSSLLDVVSKVFRRPGTWEGGYL